MKRYFVSTTDYMGNYNGLLNNGSKGYETDSLDEANNVFNVEVSYLEKHFKPSEKDCVGYYCSIFDLIEESIVEMSINYEE